MIIKASSPTRIDLAGGTLDIYPLYLLEEGALTVNMAIDLRSYVTLKIRQDKEIHIKSEDMDAEIHSKDLESLKLGSDLDLISRTLKFYRLRYGLDIYTKNTSPKGSGLGSSSSLLMALSAALCTPPFSPPSQGRKTEGGHPSQEQLSCLSKGVLSERIIDLGAELEVQNLGVPTGKQDHYAAVYGGINALWFHVGQCRREALALDEDFLKELERHLILSFTGISRLSAHTNWEMIKMYVENLGETRHCLRNIKEISLAMRESLLDGNLYGVGENLKKEWDNRKKLAEGVTTPGIEKMMEDLERVGAVGSKLCGAGGGGCMVTMVKSGKQEAVIDTLKAHGAIHLPYKIAMEGLKIEVTE